MKIRTDFVTNSSSSSFSVVLTVETKKGKQITFSEKPGWEEEWADYNYRGDISCLSAKKLTESFANREFYCEANEPDEKNHFEKMQVGDRFLISKAPKGNNNLLSGPKENCHILYLLNASEVICKMTDYSISDLYPLADAGNAELYAVVSSITLLTPTGRKKKRPEMTFHVEAKALSDPNKIIFREVADLARYLMESKKNEGAVSQATRFITKMCKEVTSVDDIALISVHREHNAWGEGADLIAEHDGDLCACAEKVVSTSGEAQKAALEAMKKLLNTPDSDRCGENFGNGYEDIRYSWTGSDQELIKKAKALVSGECIRSSYSGREHREFDFETGEYTAYALYDL